MLPRNHLVLSTTSLDTISYNEISEIFKKEDKKLTPEECLKLKNTYGIRMEDVVKMAISHDFYINKESLVKIMDEDDSHWKTVRPLAK